MKSTDLSLYTSTANASSRVVIRRYSTSFGWASRLLPGAMRDHIARIYALVRIADELVDGPAESAGVDRETRSTLLDDLEAETERGIRLGFSTNLVVHAFAMTAREHGIGMELCAPFFASMRRDLDATVFDEAALDEYIHGSAEVVGLMCLAVFEAGAVRDDRERERLRRALAASERRFRRSTSCATSRVITTTSGAPISRPWLRRALYRHSPRHPSPRPSHQSGRISAWPTKPSRSSTPRADRRSGLPGRCSGSSPTASMRHPRRR